MLFSVDPVERLKAAQAQNDKARRALATNIGIWPPNSPGSLNAWLLLATTKEPTWRDPLVAWRDAPLTLGDPHEGFFYPDPLGFWAEIRKWVSQLFSLQRAGLSTPDALSLTTLLHLGSDPSRLGDALDTFRPLMILFLDEKSWVESGIVATRIPHYISDPHRPKQVYEGFWGRRSDGLVVGKSPQHPTTHNLYRAQDMAEFLRSAPDPKMAS